MTAILALLATAATSAGAADAGERPVSDDIIVTGERTEGSGEYSIRQQTTTTRFPISKRETPQSVSVVTRAQIEDFKLNDINALLTTVPGVNVQAAETDRVYYSARGFDIQTFQIDGVGLPFAFEVQTGSIDTAIYDHIEYDFTPNLAVSANLRNVTNTKYINALNFDQGYYGAPRTVLGTISLKY